METQPVEPFFTKVVLGFVILCIGVSTPSKASPPPFRRVSPPLNMQIVQFVFVVKAPPPLVNFEFFIEPP